MAAAVGVIDDRGLPTGGSAAEGRRCVIDNVALVHIHDRKLLVARSRGKDRWYLPGGKREPGESDEETLTREIREELSVEMASPPEAWSGWPVTRRCGRGNSGRVARSSSSVFWASTIALGLRRWCSTSFRISGPGSSSNESTGGGIDGGVRGDLDAGAIGAASRSAPRLGG